MSLLKRTAWFFVSIVALVALCRQGLVESGQEGHSTYRTQEKSVTIDREKHEVRIGGWITTVKESHHCGIGWAGGTNGSASGNTKFLIETEVNPEEVFEALEAIGKKPGNNLRCWNKGKRVQGDPIRIKIYWEGAGRAYELSELVQDIKDAPLQFRFGGNLRAAKKYKTGCIICLSSCYVAIVSNSAVVLNDHKNHLFEFTHVAPPSGTEVALMFH